MDDFSIGEIKAEPGTKASGFLPVDGAGMGDGTGNFWNFPVIIVNGVEEGPIFEVDGCIHGSEQMGALTVLNLANRLNPKELKGTFVGVPVVNVPGFRMFGGVRGCFLDEYYVDMGRQFVDLEKKHPGNRRHASVTRRAVQTFWDEIIRKSNYAVNLHGTFPRTQVPRVIYRQEIPESMNMAKAIAYTPEWILSSKSEHTTLAEAGLGTATVKQGIPSVTVEYGPQTLDPEGLQANANLVVFALENCMRSLGMLKGEVKVPEHWRETEYYTHVRGGYSGILDPQPCLRVQNMVKEGELLCRVLDYLGNELEQVRAPHDGLILLEPRRVSQEFALNGLSITMVAKPPKLIK